MEGRLFELVKCGICLAELQKPLALPCLHSFCETCLQTHVRINAKGKFPCPTCRVQTMLPKNALKGFTRDFRMTEVKDIVHDYLNYKNTTPFKCSICLEESGGLSLKFCVDCRKIYCHPCLERHQMNAITNQHFTLAVRDHTQKTLKCNEHHSEDLKFYCHSCASKICISCVINDHNNHDITLVRDSNDSNGQQNISVKDYSKWVQHINIQVQHLQKLMTQINDTEQKLLKSLQDTKSGIKQHSQSLIKQVLLNEEQTLLDVNCQYNERFKEARNHKTLCGDALQKFEMLMSHIESDLSGSKTKCFNDVFKELEKIQVRNHIDKKFVRFNEFIKFIPVRTLQYGTLHKMNRSDDNSDESKSLTADDITSYKYKPPYKNSIETNACARTEIGNIRSRLDILTNCIPGQLMSSTSYLVGECCFLGTGPGQLHLPYSICFLNDDQVAVTETGNQRIQVLSVTVRTLQYGSLKKMNCSDDNSNESKSLTADDIPSFKCESPYKNSIQTNACARTEIGNICSHLDILTNCIPGQVMSSTSYLVGECCFLPYSICFLNDNQVAVTETGNQRIQVLSVTGEYINFIDDRRLIPRGICTTKDGNIAVCDEKERLVKTFRKDGKQVKCLSLPCPGFPCGLACTSSNNLVISDMIFEQIYVVDPQCNVVLKFGGHGDNNGYFDNPSFITVDSEDRIFVSDSCNHSIQVFNKDGNFLLKFGDSATGYGGLSYPKGICVNSHGEIFVCDSGNDRIVLFDKNGYFMKVLLDKNDGLRRPTGLDVRGQQIAVVMPDLHTIQIFKIN